MSVCASSLCPCLLCAVCCVLCAVCCLLCAVCCMLWEGQNKNAIPPSNTHMVFAHSPGAHRSHCNDVYHAAALCKRHETQRNDVRHTAALCNIHKTQRNDALSAAAPCKSPYEKKRVFLGAFLVSLDFSCVPGVGGLLRA